MMSIFNERRQLMRVLQQLQRMLRCWIQTEIIFSVIEAVQQTNNTIHFDPNRNNGTVNNKDKNSFDMKNKQRLKID